MLQHLVGFWEGRWLSIVMMHVDILSRLQVRRRQKPISGESGASYAEIVY
jgi:hypothetical protein